MQISSYNIKKNTTTVDFAMQIMQMQILHNTCIQTLANIFFASVCTMYMSNTNTPCVYEFDYVFEYDYSSNLKRVCAQRMSA